MHIQISLDKGFMKEKMPGFFLTGLLIMMLIPNDMNGLVKSITRSLSDVIVKGATAMSAIVSTI